MKGKQYYEKFTHFGIQLFYNNGKTFALGSHAMNHFVKNPIKKQFRLND